MDDFMTFFWAILGGSMVLSVGLTVLCTILGFLPFGLVGWYLWKRGQQAKTERLASQSWRETGGHVLKSRVEVTAGEYSSVTPYVLYEYEVHGQVYQGQQIRAGDRFMRVSDSRQAYDTVDRYPEGSTVTVYYNPSNPAEAALER